MKTHKVIHRRKKCIGCNSCCVISPNNWKMVEKDGKSQLIGSVEKKPDIFVTEIFDDELELNKSAARACPVQIIAVEENTN